ncbi:ArsR family transcriptional regulator [Mycetocola manganoxydans]|uniref:ArsR family transcriptional regulator n=1 Tax=Mycetocola manganoxydans TaxID=699879 RepID=A0A3L6ZX55_9MICO|nr:metalloregulator ArsR/SmtB family transcription factor [Mycetocola manganoxydans]RLP72350.1 ArsR family transcriptional regulator [Mycetocola manganoxydans]GHD40815.1 transcriptional regulator [Mycetocola manganoxydans]
MVTYELSDTDVDRIFQALADATRRDIVSRTLTDELSVTALAGRYDMSFAAVQKHVAVLERATLVVKRRRGREQMVQANPEAVRRAARLLDAYEKIWHDRAERIGDLLSDTTKGTEQ